MCLCCITTDKVYKPNSHQKVLKKMTIGGIDLTVVAKPLENCTIRLGKVSWNKKYQKNNSYIASAERETLLEEIGQKIE